MTELFSSVQISGLAFANRLVMPPMATNNATCSGEVTEDILEHYQKRAAAEVGTIIVEHTYVRPDGRVNDRQLGLHRDELTDGMSQLAAAIQQHGCRAVLQLTHAGAAALRGDETALQAVGTRPLPGSDTVAEPMTPGYIAKIKRCFVQAAERCVEAGFDGVQLHGAHGYLLNQFLSPLTNDRDDEYGGDERRRWQFPLEVVREVRQVTEDSLLLYYRLGADDLIEGGLTVRDTAPFAQQLVSEGVEVLDISGGLGGASPENEHCEAYFLPQAEQIAKEVGKQAAVVVTGGIVNACTADRVARDSAVDFVGVGRALLMDPYWAIKARQALQKTAL